LRKRIYQIQVGLERLEKYTHKIKGFTAILKELSIRQAQNRQKFPIFSYLKRPTIQQKCVYKHSRGRRFIEDAKHERLRKMVHYGTFIF